MSFDAWVVGFGLSRVLIDLALIASPVAYSVWLVVVLVDAYLLYRYLKSQRGIKEAPVDVEVPSGSLQAGWQRAPTRDDFRH